MPSVFYDDWSLCGTSKNSTFYVLLARGVEGGGEGGGGDKMVKPYKRLRSQSHVNKEKEKKAYRCSKFNAYCLLSCREHATLIVLSLPTRCDLASRSRSVIKTSMSICGILKSTVMPSLNVIALKLSIVRDIAS